MAPGVGDLAGGEVPHAVGSGHASQHMGAVDPCRDAVEFVRAVRRVIEPDVGGDLLGDRVGDLGVSHLARGDEQICPRPSITGPIGPDVEVVDGRCPQSDARRAVANACPTQCVPGVVREIRRQGVEPVGHHGVVGDHRWEDQAERPASEDKASVATPELVVEQRLPHLFRQIAGEIAVVEPVVGTQSHHRDGVAHRVDQVRLTRIQRLTTLPHVARDGLGDRGVTIVKRLLGAPPQFQASRIVEFSGAVEAFVEREHRGEEARVHHVAEGHGSGFHRRYPASCSVAQYPHTRLSHILRMRLACASAR